MKKSFTKSLLLFFVALAFSITASAQSLVNITNTTGPNICNGSASLVDSTANPSTIVWMYGGAILQNGGYSIQNLCPGTYIVTYSGMFGPINFTFVVGSSSVVNPCAGFSATMTTTASVAPYSGTVTVTPSGGSAPYTFSWNNGNMSTTSNSSSILNNVGAGFIDCIVYSSNGCTYSVSGVVQGSNLNPCANFITSITSQNANTIAPCNGSASVTTVGGSTPYSYVWNNGATTASISNLCAGYYGCMITDANNCVSYDSTFIAFDTLVNINNTTFPNSSVIGNLGNVSMTNCTINFAALSSAAIGGATNGLNGNVLITWILVDSNGVSTTFTVPYLTNNSNPGVFAATLTITCYQKSQDIKTIVISDQVLLPGYSLGIEESIAELYITNPFENNIEVGLEEKSSGTIELFNLQGSLVGFKEFNDLSNLNIETVSLVKGTYFISIKISGKNIVRMLIK
ncbi:MAG: T9SS type A sorting domain-containing protein [Crocinitomicaceae bacterium]|nr:T9SS type A sorting domain-containing protein [Crocinitomicaceae bacterium]